jgi:hypothetical protein
MDVADGRDGLDNLFIFHDEAKLKRLGQYRMLWTKRNC